MTLDKIFSEEYEQISRTEEENLYAALTKSSGKRVRYKFNDYYNSISERIYALKHNKGSDNSYISTDIFLDELEKEYQRKSKEYDSEPLKNFLEENLQSLKERYPSPASEWSIEKIIKFLAKHAALKNFIKKCEKVHGRDFDSVEELLEVLNSEQSLEGASEVKQTYPVLWTGGENKTQFVQLIYGLHKAKLLNNGEGEITKIVKQLAEILKVDLGKNWAGNHSKTISESKYGYMPEIFEKISTSYKEYMEMINKKK